MSSVSAKSRSSLGAAGLAVLLLAGGAVGCGAQGDGGKSSGKGSVDAPAMAPAAAVAAAAKSANAITSMHYRMTGSFPGAGHMKAEAEMGLKPLAIRMKMTSGAQAAQGPFEVRLVGKTMYVGGNAALTKETGGKSWLKFDLSALGAEGQLNTSQLGLGQANQNPAAASTFLDGSKDIKKVGTETVDGVQTTHYKGTVTLDEIRAKAEKENKTLRDRLDKSVEQYSKLGVDSLNIDMWIDGENHTKQFRMRADAKQGPMDMTIVFLDYNQPVKITAPPAGDTADLSQMMKGLQQG